MIKTNTLLLFLLFALASSAFGQKPPSKFKKISDEEINATACPIDENAHAYFIFDFGKAYFQYASTVIREFDPSSGRKGFQIFFERHYRIKILDSKGFDWANVEIPIYHDNEGNREEIIQFRAATYNREGRKIEDSKVKHNDLILEEKNVNWDVMKVALPNVRAGSVIEVEYTVKSDFPYNLQSWEFQKLIPVLHSEYHVTIPEYYYYNKSQRGYYPVTMETESRNNSVTINYESKSAARGVNKYSRTVDYEEMIYHFKAENVPAFPVEKYLTTPQNYITKIEFELAKTKFPGSSVEYYAQTWESINQQLLTNGNFGIQLNRERFLKDEVREITGLYQNDTMAIINAAYNTIKNHFTWNGLLRKFTTSSLRQAYNNRNGSSSDINLCLVVLLRELGFDAYPVLVSTRSHGLIHPSHPSMSSFNTVIACAIVGDRYYLMDATEPLSEVNLLPIQDLNNQGWLVGEDRSGWIDLQTNTYGKSASYNLTLTEEGHFTGTVDYTFTGYGAYEVRQEATKFGGDGKKYINEKYNDLSGLKFISGDIENVDSLYKDIKAHLEIELTGHLEQAGGLCFFEPFFLDQREENPFKLENRQYPVEFEYPVTEMQSITVTIPEGYVIEELPKPMIVNLDDQSAKYIYSINQMGNKIQISSVFSIHKVMFLPEQYPYLKQLMDMIVDKQQEQVVLKKL